MGGGSAPACLAPKFTTKPLQDAFRNLRSCQGLDAPFIWEIGADAIERALDEPSKHAQEAALEHEFEMSARPPGTTSMTASTLRLAREWRARVLWLSSSGKNPAAARELVQKRLDGQCEFDGICATPHSSGRGGWPVEIGGEGSTDTTVKAPSERRRRPKRERLDPRKEDVDARLSKRFKIATNSETPESKEDDKVKNDKKSQIRTRQSQNATAKVNDEIAKPKSKPKKKRKAEDEPKKKRKAKDESSLCPVDSTESGSLWRLQLEDVKDTPEAVVTPGIGPNSEGQSQGQNAKAKVNDEIAKSKNKPKKKRKAEDQSSLCPVEDTPGQGQKAKAKLNGKIAKSKNKKNKSNRKRKAENDSSLCPVESTESVWRLQLEDVEDTPEAVVTHSIVPNSAPLAIVKGKRKPKPYALRRVNAALLAQFGLGPPPLSTSKSRASLNQEAGDDAAGPGAPKKPRTAVKPKPTNTPPTKKPPPAADGAVEREAVLDARILKGGRGGTSLMTAVAPVTLPHHAPLQKGTGIRASTFAAAFRLIVGLPRPQKRPPTHKLAAPPTTPPVWAETRQELCESLPYYRAFQSGMYMHKRVAYGYLLDGYPSPRDEWAADGRVIISHGGGAAIRTIDAKGNPTISLSADHTRADARIDTLLRAYERGTPVILLAGEGYALLPWTLGCAYAVLGWYWISAAWFEAEPVGFGVRPPEKGRDFFWRLKVRFDWVESQGEPWWVKPGVGSWRPPTLKPEDANVPPGREVQRAVPPQDAEWKTPPVQRPLFRAHICSQSTVERRALEIGRSTQDIPSAHELTASVPAQSSSSAPEAVPPKNDSAPSSEDVDIAELQARLWAQPVTASSSELPKLKADGVVSTQPARPPPPRTSPHPLPANGHEPSSSFITRACHTCKQTSPRIYAEGWVCLVVTCSSFWMMSFDRDLVLPVPPNFSFTYDAAFLAHVATPECIGQIPFDVVPPPPPSAAVAAADTASMEGNGELGSRTLWRGWVCTGCGRANCRYRWEVCECRACGLQTAHLSLTTDVVPSTAIHREDDADVLGELDMPSADLLMSVRRLAAPRATVVTYELPVAGTVYHILADTTHDADPIWEAYQRAAIDTSAPLFQRRALQANTVKGSLLSQQFAINSGAAYKYIVETLSYTFAESPGCVTDALELIRDRVAAVLGERVEFNEILSVMYREGQKMSWHDDGEPGLGPVVAALSLGASATMSFRPKKVKTGKGPGGAGSTSKGDGAGGRADQSRAVLNLRLNHGDVVIMSGRRIQQLYNHKVVPCGLRVAATARVIRGG